MKIFTSVFVLATVFFSCVGHAQTHEIDEQVMKLIKDFYKSYILENSKMPPDNKKIELLKRKYCSKNFLNKLSHQELDYDPFLKAQDSDTAWLKTLSVNKSPQMETVYVVSYRDSFTKEKIIVKLNIVREKGEYKIDAAL